jgi:XTP/dITP diphosphohydrolase
MELVIASENTQKVHEIRNMLKEVAPSLLVLSLFDFPNFRHNFSHDLADVDSFEENAKAKALFAATSLGKACLADSSGIVVPALLKAGSKSYRRFEHPSKSPISQTKALLQEMKNYADLERQSYLECSLAIASPKGDVKSVIQRQEGLIADEAKGETSFEFDSIFIKHDYSKTLGELAPSVRARISHRRKALEKLLPHILRFAAKS